MNLDFILDKTFQNKIWNNQPVFCFTSDIDWASEAVLEYYFEVINTYELKPTLFVTHRSKTVERNYFAGKIETGIHPNFLPDSSQGKTYEDVIKYCYDCCPGNPAQFRCHRAFDCTDVTHFLKNKGFTHYSNYITAMQPYIRPVIHESGLINFPVFFEDGTYLYNEFPLKFNEWLFSTPGIKVISIHPMHLILNSPDFKFMRNLKDTLGRERYCNLTESEINKLKQENGIANMLFDIIRWVKQNEFPVFTLNELYKIFMQ